MFCVAKAILPWMRHDQVVERVVGGHPKNANSIREATSSSTTSSLIVLCWFDSNGAALLSINGTAMCPTSGTTLLPAKSHIVYSPL